MTILQDAARKALEYIEGATAGLLAKIDAIESLRTALAQQGQEPIAWAVQGCSRMWRGEFAEDDAKAEAARCGGTCYAYPLYTAAPAPLAQPREITDEEIDLLWQSDYEIGLNGIREFARAVLKKASE